MAVFKAFKPEAMNKIAKAMGYTGDMGQFQSYIEQDPMRQQQMQQFTNAAMQMAKGGVVKMQTGGAMMGPAQNAAGAYDPQTGQFTPLNQLKDQFALTPQTGGLIQMGAGAGPLMGPAQDGMYRGQGSVGPGPLLQTAVTPQTFNYTYEQAVTANANRAVKSPAEQAAIDAAIARGPAGDSTSCQHTCCTDNSTTNN